MLQKSQWAQVVGLFGPPLCALTLHNLTRRVIQSSTRSEGICEHGERLLITAHLRKQ